MTAVAPLNRTLEQELLALLRGASLECLVCGEFVLYRRGLICCPECGLTLTRDEANAGSAVEFDSQAG
jgi:predicted amidophosphoribosyltransferase